MATLHVRNVPEGLYKRLQAIARQERRSLSAQTILLLEEAISPTGHRREPMSRILQRIRARREPMSRILQRIRARREPTRLPENWPGSLELLREDRSR